MLKRHRFALAASSLGYLLAALMYAGPSIAQPISETTVFAPLRPGGTKIALETVVSGLTAPVKGTVAPGLPDRLFVVDQTGQIWVVNLVSGTRSLLLDVNAHHPLVPLGVCGPNTFDERGLLGLAFHPDFQNNGLFYTYTSEPNAGPATFPTTLPLGTAPDHQNVLRKWHAVTPSNPENTVIHSFGELVRIDWPQFNHNGGDLSFGPDGMLYISTGDGGGADDRDGQLFITTAPGCPDAPIVGHGLDGNGQKLTAPLGKFLRIDVDLDGDNPVSANGAYEIPADNPFVAAGGGVIEEIWAYGFRNPWRWSFDTASGTLYVSDVGQNDLEEVDVVMKGGNYGWRHKEGTKSFNPNNNDPGFACDPATGPFPCPTPPGGLIDPIAQYDTEVEGHAVIGGFIYRGSRIPQLKGRYVFGEFSVQFDPVFPGGPFVSGRLFYLQQKKQPNERLMNIQEFKVAGLEELGLAVLGFGQDAEGEVYLMANVTGIPFGTGGVVLRIAPVSNK